MAFEKWIQKKEQLEIQRLQKQALENAENERRLAQEEQKLLERNQRKQDTLRQWAKSKNATREAEEAARQQKENEERKRLQDKKTKSEEAFLKWKAQKGKPGAISKDHVYHHSRAWVDTAVPNAADEPSPNSLRSLSSKENILSPPHMYNEYNKYTIQAPEFLKRYRAQVASAGIPPPSLPIRRKYKSGSLPKLNKVPISK